MNIDGSEETNALKDRVLKAHGIDVRRVPMGILYHPKERGIIGKVKLNRKNLRLLKEKIEAYLEGELDLISLLDSYLEYDSEDKKLVLEVRTLEDRFS